MKQPKRPRDPAQLAKFIVDVATGEKSDAQLTLESDMTDAQRFARTGGIRGGRARAEKLTAEERSKIAANAARTRWGKRERGD